MTILMIIPIILQIPEQLGVDGDDPCITDQWECRGVKGLGGRGN
jgi:hypothetical protein